MKIVITQDQIKLIKESTNRSAKLLGKFYDIEADGAYYLGNSMIQSRVRFTPKDFDNPMTPQYGESICNWKIDKPFSSVPGDVTFAAMNLPDSFNVPLMDHIGNTGELEKYLKELHMEEVEEFIKRIIDIRNNNPLNESVDRKKKLFIDLLGQDLIDSIRTITSPKQLPKEFSKSLGSSRIKAYIGAYGPLYYFVFEGEPFIYKDRVSPKGEEYEMYVNRKGESFFNNQISNRLGLSDVGLKFLDVINTFHNDEEPLNEGSDMSGKTKENIKLENLLKRVLENKEFEYSFTDRTEGVWDGYEYEIIKEEYTFKYHMVVNYVLGVGSGSVADINVIIDDIILDGESVYDGWVEIGYSENVWYIKELRSYLNDEVFNVFPFSIYPTCYGHDEEK